MWSDTLEEIQKNINHANFVTWFEGSFGHSLANNTLVVGVKSSFVAECLAKSHRGLVEKALFTVSSMQLQVEFRVAEE